jgi:ferredoxin-thioredoxin reductase catalytic subunit
MEMNREIIQKQFLELTSIYQRLSLVDEGEPKNFLIKGILDFTGRGKDQLISDSFEIEILIPETFPNVPPSVKEIGGRIPSTFHHYDDGSLCLGTPLHIRMSFLQNPTLLGYVQDLVIPYLFSYCYWKKFGRMPFGELSHGRKGIMEYYRELFQLNSDISTIKLLKIIAEDNYRGHQTCPCGSGKILRQCHGEILRKIKIYQYQNDFIDDYCRCILYLKKNVKRIPTSLISQKVLQHIEKNEAALGKNKKRSINP